MVMKKPSPGDDWRRSPLHCQLQPDWLMFMNLLTTADSQHTCRRFNLGKHYVPQNYLKGFSDPANQEMIWMSDKSKPTDKPKHLPIKAVAQSHDFYTPQAERWLNKVVEMPAQEPLRRLAIGERIHGVDRLIVAIYIQVMMLRVPHARTILGGMVRGGVADFVAEIKANPDEIPADMSKESFFELLDRRL